MSGVINTFPVFGQESPGSGAGSNPRDMPRENLPRVVGPGILPDLMVMQNEKGEEILVPRTRYEDFEKILLETEFGEQGIGGNASINQLDLVIEPIADYAKVDVRGTVVLKKPNRVARTVAIGLGQLQWLPKVEKSDSGTDPIRPGVDTDKGQVPDGLESLATSSQSAGYLWRLAQIGRAHV